jgi:hypothetical protein
MKLLALLVAAAALAGCAAGYEPRGGRGGYQEKQIEENFFRLTYTGNAATTQETVQTYWLYRAAELALEKSFDGFEIASTVSFVGVPSNSPYVRAQMIFLPMPNMRFPLFEADIILLKAPIVANPPKVFDARSLKTELNVYVKRAGSACLNISRPEISGFAAV